jgi:hypothetical protein
MRNLSLTRVILALACGLIATAPAQAAVETWVSGNGTDSGNCQITAPCRTFQFAHGQTNNNGTINVLSSGIFGPLTITKPISIVAQGVEAVINTGADGAGIIVQAGGAAVVSLRGLTIDLRGTDNQGIAFLSGAALHVRGCVIRKATDGISFAPVSGVSELYVADTLIADIAGTGISVRPTGSGGLPSGSAEILAMVNRVRVEQSLSGMEFSGLGTTGTITATVRDSAVTGTREGTGISGRESSGGTTTVMIDRTSVVNNSLGVRSTGAGATVLIGDSVVTGNANGLVVTSGGVMRSYGTNQVNGNSIDGSPSSTIGMK